MTEEEIRAKCVAQVGSGVLPGDIIWVDGDYTIDGMPWREWLNAMTED